MKRPGRRSLIALVVATTLVPVGAFAFIRIGASAIVTAPNARRAPVESAAPPDATAFSVDVSSPTARISTWLFEPTAPRGTVFVLHGIRDSKASQLGWGRMLSRAGFRAVLVDSRGHGGSTGDVLSYGVFESHDLTQVADAIAARGKPLGRLGAMGSSYGGGTAIQWAGRDARVRAVVAIAPFPSLRAITPDYLHRLVPVLGRLVPQALIDAAIDRAGHDGGFDPDRASSFDALATTTAPVLIFHGEDDRHIPIHHSEAMAARAPGRVTLVRFPSEDHDSIGGDRSGILGRRIPEFFAAKLTDGGAP